MKIAESAEKAARFAEESFKSYRRGNPLIVRKTFRMRDAFFRKDQSDVELFHCDIAFDTEWCAVTLILIGAVLLLCRCVGKCRARHRIRRNRG